MHVCVCVCVHARADPEAKHARALKFSNQFTVLPYTTRDRPTALPTFHEKFIIPNIV